MKHINAKEKYFCAGKIIFQFFELFLPAACQDASFELPNKMFAKLSKILKIVPKI